MCAFHTKRACVYTHFVTWHGFVCKNLHTEKVKSFGCTSFRVGQRWNTRCDMLIVTHRQVFRTSAQRCSCKINMNFQEKIKTTQKETDWKFRRLVKKVWSRNWKSESRRRQNVVEKSQIEYKTLDAIDDGHYHTVVTEIFDETTYSTRRPWRQGEFRQTKKSRDIVQRKWESRKKSISRHRYKSPRRSVRRRGKSISSSSKSNPLRRRGKNYDASMLERRRRCRKNVRKSTNFQQKFVWFTYSNNVHTNSGCPLYISEGQNGAWTKEQCNFDSTHVLL